MRANSNVFCCNKFLLDQHWSLSIERFYSDLVSFFFTVDHVTITDFGQSDCFCGIWEKGLLPGSGENPPAEENHPLLCTVLVQHQISGNMLFDPLGSLTLTVICYCVFRFTVAFVYYGISFRISGFGLNLYLTHFIYSVIEVPAKIITFFVLDSIGRRNGQAWFLITTGALIGINTAIPLGWISFILNMEFCSDRE